jgi:BlaI family transcriptional regulator, penicillinase repressor
MQTPKISPAEWQVMKLLWEKAPRTAQEVIDLLASYTEWHPKTIRTLLTRLVEKGALRTVKQGRLLAYLPCVDESAAIHEESQSFLDRVFGGGLQPMLAHFLEREDVSDEEIAALRQLLNKKAKGGNRS